MRRPRNQRPKALHVFGALSVGGAESWLAQALPVNPTEFPWRLELCLLADHEGPFAKTFRDRGYSVVACPAAPILTFPSRFLRLLRSGDYDAVHSHVLLFSGAILALAALGGVPLRLAHAHNDDDGRRRSPLRIAYRAAMRVLLNLAATRVIGCTARAARTLGVGEKRLRTLPYGVDLDRFGPPESAATLRASLGAPADAFIIGHCGRLDRQKNQRFLIEVFAHALTRDPSLYLVIAGEGELRASLEAAARDSGAADRIRFLGLRSDIPRLLVSAFDLFLMPSLHEGLPVALIEAQAAGLPCLVSDRVNPETIVDHERVRALPLDAGLDRWAAALVDLARVPRTPVEESKARIRVAGLDARSSGRRLAALYAEAWGDVAGVNRAGVPGEAL